MRQLFRALSFGAVLTLSCSIMTLWAQAADPASGTWELNLAKSKFTPGPAPKSMTRTIEVTGDELKYTTKGVGAEGQPTLVEFTAKYDGKDYPVTGAPDYDAVSLKRINAATVAGSLKKSGKVVYTVRRVVSKDGTRTTITVKGKNAKGQRVTVVQVFDKR